MRRLAVPLREPLPAAANGRFWLAVATISLLAASVVAILGTLSLGWRFGMAHADLPTRVNTVVAVCAFILVGASVVVAVLAYIAATGRPDLMEDGDSQAALGPGPQGTPTWTRPSLIGSNS